MSSTGMVKLVGTTIGKITIRGLGLAVWLLEWLVIEVATSILYILWNPTASGQNPAAELGV